MWLVRARHTLNAPLSPTPAPSVLPPARVLSGSHRWGLFAPSHRQSSLRFRQIPHISLRRLRSSDGETAPFPFSVFPTQVQRKQPVPGVLPVELRVLQVPFLQEACFAIHSLEHLTKRLNR